MTMHQTHRFPSIGAALLLGALPYSTTLAEDESAKAKTKHKADTAVVEVLSGDELDQLPREIAETLKKAGVERKVVELHQGDGSPRIHKIEIVDGKLVESTTGKESKPKAGRNEKEKTSGTSKSSSKPKVTGGAITLGSTDSGADLKEELEKTLKEAGLEEAIIRKVMKSMKTAMPKIMVAPSQVGDAKAVKPALPGHAKIIKGKTILIGPDGKSQTIEFGSDDNPNLDSILKLALKGVDAPELDIEIEDIAVPKIESKIFGIGPALVVEETTAASQSGTGIREELKTIKKELAEQRKMLQQILKALQ